MKLHFNQLPYQDKAVASVVDLFSGESTIAQRYIKKNTGLFSDTVANTLPVDIETIQENLNQIQKINRLSLTDEADELNFCISMETGTGKTYVYTKTIYELNEQYGLTKFIIVVPSIAIREGVKKSFEITHEHFQNLYNKKPIRWFVYNSSRLADVREFAQSNNIEVMIINIDAFRKNENIFNMPSDKFNGESPKEVISEVKPVIIIDEPQSVANTQKAKDAISWLNPLFILRYSATHREEINTLYSLTPVDAYQQGLVKQVSVSSIASQDNYNQPYIKLLSVDNANGYRAKIELDVKAASGKINRVIKNIGSSEDLFLTSNERDIYRDWRVTDIDCQPGFEKIELNGAYQLFLGQAMGDVSEQDIRRGQIRKTIEHHLDKELRFLPKGIKVLSLFFLDRVDRYRVYEGNAPQKGEYAKMFEEEYAKLIAQPRYQTILNTLPFATDATQAHDGYFSADKKGKLKDTRGDTADDQSTYSLIMKDKEKLLSMATPLRFIFSHSALKEGWDNPNVFQVCTLLEQTSALTARQKIGRGLRLCVNQAGERVYDKNTNLLHVIATESYADFADKLQKEIETETGIKFGVLDISTFIDMDITVTAAVEMGIEVPEETKQEYEEWQQEVKEQPQPIEESSLSLQGSPQLPKFVPQTKIEPTVKLGHEAANKLLDALVENKIIDKKGKITKEGREKLENNTNFLPEAYQPIANPIIREIRKANTKLPIRDASKEVLVRRKEGAIESPEFLEIWNRISQKTLYRVEMKKDRFIESASAKIAAMTPIEKAKIEETTAMIDVKKEGITAQETSTRTKQLDYSFTTIPDILSVLKYELKLTKSTILEILKRSGRLDDLLNNPEKFIEEVYLLMKNTKAEMLSDGIKYIKIKGEEYSAQEVFEKEELLSYIDNAIATNRSVYDYVVVDESNIERNFAKDLEKDPDVRFFFKLPDKFKIDTPFGTYNPDWAVLLNEYGADKLYLVIETKGTLQDIKRRVEENAKINCARLHFKELNGVKYDDATTWKSVKPSA